MTEIRPWQPARCAGGLPAATELASQGRVWGVLSRLRTELGRGLSKKRFYNPSVRLRPAAGRQQAPRFGPLSELLDQPPHSHPQLPRVMDQRARRTEDLEAQPLGPRL